MGGLTSLLLLLCVGVTVCRVVDLHKRIQGGRDCRHDERHYHVKFTYPNGNHLCGGSLISDQWILTAAHCNETGMRAVVGVHPGPEQQNVPITTKPVMFEDQGRFHDIMLLRLPNPTPLPHIPLPDCRPGQAPPLPPMGATVQIAGHGPTNRSSTIPSPTLQCADITVAGCGGLLWRTADPDRNVFCGSADGITSCPGDSGGGVVHDGKIYGVIKGSGPNPNECGRIVGLMRVCEYIDWIRNITALPPQPGRG